MQENVILHVPPSGNQYVDPMENHIAICVLLNWTVVSPEKKLQKPQMDLALKVSQSTFHSLEWETGFQGSFCKGNKGFLVILDPHDT